MTPDDADLVLALESCAEVEGVFAMASPRPGWPRIFVALRDDSGYALGVVTGMMVRALPHRDRSYIGIAATDRLRELWSMGAPLVLSRAERDAAVERARIREIAYAKEPTPLRVRVDVSEPAPLSVPVVGPFRARTVWMMVGDTLMELEVIPDPFREEPPALLVVTERDELWERITRAAPTFVKPVRARSVREAMATVRSSTRGDYVPCDSVGGGGGVVVGGGDDSVGGGGGVAGGGGAGGGGSGFFAFGSGLLSV